MEMDNFTFGVTMLVAGMGGTLVTLGILSLMMAGHEHRDAECEIVHFHNKNLLRTFE